MEKNYEQLYFARIERRGQECQWLTVQGFTTRLLGVCPQGPGTPWKGSGNQGWRFGAGGLAQLALPLCSSTRFPPHVLPSLGSGVYLSISPPRGQGVLHAQTLPQQRLPQRFSIFHLVWTFHLHRKPIGGERNLSNDTQPRGPTPRLLSGKPPLFFSLVVVKYT